MTFFPDLSEYVYWTDVRRPNTKNIGWLGAGHPFPIGELPESDLSKLWDCCEVSVAQTRGIHLCEFCGDGSFATRSNKALLLGSAEIRVFGDDGTIFAAPTMIYHYVSDHSYRPPAEFIAALRSKISCDLEAYTRKLKELNIAYRQTSSPEQKPRRYILTKEGKKYLD